MCDIGRFDYHFVEADDRLQRPLAQDAGGLLQPVDWHDLLVKLREATGAIRSASLPLRFLVSAHASLEELALFGQIARGLYGDGAEQQIGISLAGERQGAAGEHEVHDAPRWTRRTSRGASDLGLDARGFGRRRRGPLGAAGGGGSGQGRRALRVRSGPAGIDRRHRLGHRGAEGGAAQAAGRPGHPDDGPGARRRPRAARRQLRREGRLLHERTGAACRPPRRRSRPGRRDGGLADPRERRR